MQLRNNLIYGFTGFSIVQLIGYLGISYTWLSQPMFILVLMMVLACLLLGVSEWAKTQAGTVHALPKAQLWRIFGATLAMITTLLFVLFVGIWIGL
jgi:hypothetical protein